MSLEYIFPSTSISQLLVTMLQVVLRPSRKVLVPKLLAVEVRINLLASLLRCMGNQFRQSTGRNVGRRRIDAFLESMRFLRLLTQVAVVQLRLAFVQDLHVFGIEVLDQGIFALGAVDLAKARSVIGKTADKLLAVFPPVIRFWVASGLAHVFTALFQEPSG